MLGISWDFNTDLLKFNISNKVVPEIKRGILCAISSIFDRMGLITPMIVKIRIINSRVMEKRVRLGH